MTEYTAGERVVITEGDFAGSVATVQVDGQILRVITNGRGHYEKWVFDYEVKREGEK